MTGFSFLRGSSWFAGTKRLPPGCESIVEPQEEGGESEGGEDVEEQTGAGTDVRSRLDVRFGLQPVEKDLNRLPQGTDAAGGGGKGGTRAAESAL